MSGMRAHHVLNQGISDTWLTPPEILGALGPFDLDPCCPPNMPWPTAACMMTEATDGLQQPWNGRVWLNPPYGPATDRWMQKLAELGRGTALIFARTETACWHRWIWPRATAVNFLEGRLFFHLPDGTRAKHNGGAPSALIAYGEEDARLLSVAAIPGYVIRLR